MRLINSEHKSAKNVEIYGIDGKRYIAKLIELPFYDKEFLKKIPRGLKGNGGCVE